MTSIKLPNKVWEQIATACIEVVNLYELGLVQEVTKRTINALRKTYFQIKAETR